MATLQIVETSLRDGNQCLWGALGIDTARTLTIAPVMDRVGFTAIDFTTSHPHGRGRALQAARIRGSASG